MRFLAKSMTFLLATMTATAAQEPVQTPPANVEALHQLNLEPEKAGLPKGPNGREVFISLADRIMIIEEGNSILASYPIAIGRPDYPTPTGEFKVIDMDDSPTGAPVVSARWLGFLHTANKQGPVELGIHGTMQSSSIGTEASHGCIRLRNQDAIEAFNLLAPGDPIHIIRTPFPRAEWEADIRPTWRRIDVAIPAGRPHQALHRPSRRVRQSTRVAAGKGL